MPDSVFERDARIMLSLHQNAAQSVDRRGAAPYPVDKPSIGLSMDLFEEIVRLRRAGKRGALATIVHTNGSIHSYESSRMLVREDGSIAGTIGGGCVETDLWGAGREVMATGASPEKAFQL